MASHDQKFESSIQIYTEGNNLFEEADKLFDEADELSNQEDKISEEIDRVGGESDNLREEQNELYRKYNLAVDEEKDGSIFLKTAEEIDPKLFQLESDSLKLRRSMREIGLKHSELRTKARVIVINGAKLHAESRKVWLEGMIEWKSELV